MTCVELQQSLAEIDDGSSAEQKAHLESCPRCLALMAELNLIATSARELSESDEPSPRVWNSIEIALRQEGLIRPQRSNRPHPFSFAAHRNFVRWMIPAGATLLVLLGIYVFQNTRKPEIATAPQPQVQVSLDAAFAGLNDEDLMQEVADKAPAMKEQYKASLQQANQYIQDARQDVEADPNDDEARRSLVDAYQQKAMLFDMAMDHTLP